MGLAAVILAACLLPPLWVDLDETGACIANPLLDCACEEIVWDHPDETAVEWYEIERETMSNGAKAIVGIVTRWEDDIGNPIPPNRAFHTGRSLYFPHYGTDYRYRVRACNAIGCSEWSPDYVDTRGFLFACFDETGDEDPCYVGAPLRCR